MARTANLSPFQDEKGRWRLSIPPSLSPTGKRSRPVFKTEADAQKSADELQGKIKKVEVDLSGAGIGFVETALEYQEKFQWYGYTSLFDACEEFLTVIKEKREGRSFSEIIADTEKELGAAWNESIWQRHNRCKGALGATAELAIDSMDAKYWREWLDKNFANASPATRNDQRAWLHKIYEIAVNRSWAVRNPIKGVVKLPTGEKEISVFTNDEVKQLMEYAWKHDREMVRYFALAIFAGLRTACEIERPESGVQWSDVNFNEGWLRVNSSKSGLRFVPIESALKAWLWPVRKKSGLICPTNHRKRRVAITEGASVRWGSDYRDIARHTYGSNLDGLYRDADKIRDAMGHTNYATFRKHYKNTRTPKQAKEFWAITPANDHE